MIHGERVKLARELRGLTQTELARRVDVSQTTIAHVEGGRVQPSDGLVEAIAFQTGMLPSFFRKPHTVEFPLGSLLFRRRAAMSAGEEKRVHRAGEVVYEIAHELRRRIQPLPVRLPRGLTDPVEAARATRSALGLSPDTPIKNLTRALERGGVLILVIPMAIESGDAYSGWMGDDVGTPVIVVSGSAPGDRLRLTLAHETGHLVLPHALRGDVAAIEREAYTFGVELLLPATAMREELTPPVTLAGLVEMKRRWGVSLQVLIRRANDLEIITKRQYSYLFQQLSARGWRTREPAALDVPIERPRAVRQMVEMLYDNPIDYQRLAADMSIPTQFIRQIMEGYAGGEVAASSTGEAPPRRDNVRRFDSGGGAVD